MKQTKLIQQIRRDTKAWKKRRELRLEELDARDVPAVTASFIPGGTLTINGDANANSIVVSRDSGGTILVNGGKIAVSGGVPTVANTALIQVFGGLGNDTIAMLETKGALPSAALLGGDGNDTLIGGAGADSIFGQNGNDFLLGKGSSDELFGGAGNDGLTAGTGDDTVFGDGDNDRVIWNPGEGSDVIEGGDGSDTVEVNGGNGSESFSIVPNGTRVRFDRVDPAPFFLDIGAAENLVVNANGGDDRVVAGNGLAPLIKLTIDGGAGQDGLIGGDGDDVIFGGDGLDTVFGGRGNDVAFLGDGDDFFTWNPGDGSDTVEGQKGIDRLIFNGANIAEEISVSANGARARLFRNVANITMDLNDLEKINMALFGGADTVGIDSLAGTDVTNVNVDLSFDNSPDRVFVNGTNGADKISATGAGSGLFVNGLRAQVGMAGLDGLLDSLIINALGGNDTVDASKLQASISFSSHLGAGYDRIVGSPGGDVLIGEDGNDTMTGGGGGDVILMGAGNDTSVWNPGDGNDAVEGQAGKDTLTFNGSNASENVDVSANGGRVRFFRDVAAVTMDLDDIETIAFNAHGGADFVAVNDMSGTDLKLVRFKLAGLAVAKGDGASDAVLINGTNGQDKMTVGTTGAETVISGLATQVRISGAEAADRLNIHGLGGDDLIDGRKLLGNRIQFIVDAGLGADTVFGSAGQDWVIGGDGNDTAFLGAGVDSFYWVPGDDNDIVEGGSGADRLLFNGSNASENIAISANGNRARFFRDIANVTMDLKSFETIDFNPFGGADTIVVEDLTGSGVKNVNITMSPDGQADTVIVNGTAKADKVSVAASEGITSVSGLTATVRLSGAEFVTDSIRLNLLGGADKLDASKQIAGLVSLVADGGGGGDTLIGSAGNDVLSGGEDNDSLDGGAGADFLDGGDGVDQFENGELVVN